MQKTRRIVWSLTSVASICWISGRAMGQADGQAPQYPQYVQYPQGAPPVTPAAPGAQVNLTPGQVDQLLASIALYPDPLLSMIFPAATYPQDITAAEQWLEATPNPTEADIDAQSWDASIKGLVHYPSVLSMMSTQMDWTQTVGAAFLNQQQDVLDSVQRLRAQAQTAQNLQTDSQEQVVEDDGAIRIEPVDPDLMYVPQYDPSLVYTGISPVSFGVGYPIGLWCDNDFDWNNHSVVIGGGWYSGWNHPAAWDQHPPTWDRHGAGWVAAPKAWARAPREAAPRLMATAVSRLNVDRPRGATAANSAPAAPRRSPAPIGRQPAPELPRNAFDPAESRNEVQHAVQRARPAAQPAAEVRPPVNDQPRPSPREAAPTPTPRAEAPAAARSVSAPSPRTNDPPAARSAPSSALGAGESGSDARAQSARGHASTHR